MSEQALALMQSVIRKKNFLDMDKAFLIAFDTCYADIFKNYREYPYIDIGFYGNGYCDGQFTVEWTDKGIQLSAYDDSWEALYKMPEVTELLTYLSSNRIRPSIYEFADMLKARGYKNITNETN